MKMDKEFKKAAIKLSVGATAGVICLTAFFSDEQKFIFSNIDKFDTEKKFNTLVEANGDNVSLVFVKNYYDNSGSTVQIRTQDGLEVLTSLKNAQLLDVSDYQQAYEYANRLAAGDDDKVFCYDENQDLSLDIEKIGYKKHLLRSYNFNYAIVLEDDGLATLYEVASYRRWSDDKIQFTTVDGDVLLKSADMVKLLSIDNASMDSVYEYATSLVGDDDNLIDNTIKVYKKQK